MEKDVLPIGTIVYVKEGLKKVMIIGRCLTKEKDNVQYYFDYTACLYPEGLTGEEVLFINKEDISNIVFKGYEDDDNAELVKRILTWQENGNVKKGSFEIFNEG
ncbi:MAG: DUF4176 domain-containing protein [Coprobacillaceae bacterium]